MEILSHFLAFSVGAGIVWYFHTGIKSEYDALHNKLDGIRDAMKK